MAKKEPQPILEREYIVPLNKGWIKRPRYKRAKKAVTYLKQFLIQHMKAEDGSKVKIGSHLNQKIWASGIKNPPRKVKIAVSKNKEGIVRAELAGVKKKEEKPKRKFFKRRQEKESKPGEEKSEKGKGSENKKSEKTQENKEKQKNEKSGKEKKAEVIRSEEKNSEKKRSREKAAQEKEEEGKLEGAVREEEEKAKEKKVSKK